MRSAIGVVLDELAYLLIDLLFSNLAICLAHRLVEVIDSGGYDLHALSDARGSKRSVQCSTNAF